MTTFLAVVLVLCVMLALGFPIAFALGLAGVIGASAMVVDQLFARESIGRWLSAGSPTGVPEVALAHAG